MTEDRLAEVKNLLAQPRPPGSATDPVTGRLTRDHLIALVGEVERLRGLLGRLEWIGDPEVSSGKRCPVCYVAVAPHFSDCWLAAELRQP